MSKIDESRPFLPVNIQVVTVSDTRSLKEDKSGQALEDMKPIDREILMLRYFERLSMKECGQVLGLSLSGAKVRHLNATERLHQVLSAHEGMARRFSSRDGPEEP